MDSAIRQGKKLGVKPTPIFTQPRENRARLGPDLGIRWDTRVGERWDRDIWSSEQLGHLERLGIAKIAETAKE